MSESTFQPFADQGVIHVDPNPSTPAVKYVGGVTWIASMTAGGKVVVRCSVPVGREVRFSAEITYFGLSNATYGALDKAVRVTVDRDGWKHESAGSIAPQRSANCCVGVLIQVLGKGLNPSAPQVNDVILQVEDREYPANICHLSCVSPVFKQALNLSFPEGEPRKVTLDKVASIAATDFAHFMRAINEPDLSTLSKNNIAAVRSLADRFEVAQLLTLCDEFICRTAEMSLFEKFKLAEQWQSKPLAARLTASIVSIVDLKLLLAEA